MEVTLGSRCFLRGTGDQKINIFNIFLVFSIFSVHHCTYRITFDECINARGWRCVHTGYRCICDLVLRGVHKTVPLLRPFLKIVNYSQKYGSYRLIFCALGQLARQDYLWKLIWSLDAYQGVQGPNNQYFYILRYWLRFLYTIKIKSISFRLALVQRVYPSNYYEKVPKARL